MNKDLTRVSDKWFQTNTYNQKKTDDISSQVDDLMTYLKSPFEGFWKLELVWIPPKPPKDSLIQKILEIRNRPPSVPTETGSSTIETPLLVSHPLPSFPYRNQVLTVANQVFFSA